MNLKGGGKFLSNQSENDDVTFSEFSDYELLVRIAYVHSGQPESWTNSRASFLITATL